MSIIWADSAKADLREAIAYVASDSPAAASRIKERVETVAQMLAASPHAGRRSAVAGLRELSVPRTRYRLVYSVDGDDVHIVRVMHSSRNWPPES